MKRWLFVLLLSILLVGCSNGSSSDSELLSELATFNFNQSFSLEEEKSITITVEGYEYGKRKSEPLMYFGNHFKGDGEIQFSYFRPDHSTSNPQLIESFEVAAIRSGDQIISNKMINALPYFPVSFVEAKQKPITKDGEYIIVAYGYMTPYEMPEGYTKFPQIKIQQRKDFIEAYKSYPLVYLVIVEVQ